MGYFHVEALKDDVQRGALQLAQGVSTLTGQGAELRRWELEEGELGVRFMAEHSTVHEQRPAPFDGGEKGVRRVGCEHLGVPQTEPPHRNLRGHLQHRSCPPNGQQKVHQRSE